MTLWSSEKMYFRRKPSSGWAWVWAPGEWLTLMRGPRGSNMAQRAGGIRRWLLRLPAALLLEGLAEPGLEVFFRRVNVQPAAHRVVPPAAQFGAGDLPGIGRVGVILPPMNFRPHLRGFLGE